LTENDEKLRGAEGREPNSLWDYRETRAVGRISLRWRTTRYYHRPWSRVIWSW